jgi:hypothetical protein
VVGRRSAAARLFVPLSLAAVGSLLVACSSPAAHGSGVGHGTVGSDLSGTLLDGASLDGALFDNVIGARELAPQQRPHLPQ